MVERPLESVVLKEGVAPNNRHVAKTKEVLLQSVASGEALGVTRLVGAYSKHVAYKMEMGRVVLRWIRVLGAPQMRS